MSHITKLLAATALFGIVGCADADTGDVVGPRGGMVISDDGRLTLVVPAGALDEDVAIEVVMSDDLMEDPVGPTYTLLPMGTAFAVPATVSYEIGDMAMEDYRQDTLSLIVEKGEDWYYLADQYADEDHISGSATYLSSFTVVAERTDKDDKQDEDN